MVLKHYFLNALSAGFAQIANNYKYSTHSARQRHGYELKNLRAYLSSATINFIRTPLKFQKVYCAYCAVTLVSCWLSKRSIPLHGKRLQLKNPYKSGEGLLPTLQTQAQKNGSSFYWATFGRYKRGTAPCLKGYGLDQIPNYSATQCARYAI